MALKPFGTTAGGEPVWLAELNAGCISVEIITYGATIHRILAPDRRGDMADVILGKDDLAGYAARGAPSAAFIGRVANRIKNHAFAMNGKKHVLEANEGSTTLHSAGGNYAAKNFAVIEAGDAKLRLAARDLGEAGFPGEVSVEVLYTVDDDALTVEYCAIPTADTPINFTNHAYFNLAGQDGGPVYGHTLTIDANFYTPSDKHDIPTGEILKTAKTPFDFTKPRNLGEAMKELEYSGDRHNGFDHNYVLNGDGWRKVAQASDESSGRILEIFTDLPGVQLYTANNIKEGTKGKGGATYQRHSGLCLETQFFPDSIHKPHFPGGIAMAYELFSTATAYRFKAK